MESPIGSLMLILSKHEACTAPIHDSAIAPVRQI